MPGIRRKLALTLTFCLLVMAAGSFVIGSTKSSDNSTEAFLNDLQQRTFRWFWDWTDPSTGLTPDRTPNPPFYSIAAVGFALTAYPVGVERGYVSRPQAAGRVLTTLRFFWHAPQGPGPQGVSGYRGFFYHFLRMEDGTRYRRSELSTMDTALLMAGVLDCQSYFDAPTPVETEIRDLADRLYRRVEWTWIQPRPPLISMGWTPEKGFNAHDYEGYSESMILYLLALGSPTHAIAPEAWNAFTRSYHWVDFYGNEHVNFSPLFGHQYSQIWVDFRNIRDAYMREKGSDYFENSRRAVYSNRAYCIDNPGGWKDYSEDIWGLTASDGPANLRKKLGQKTLRFRTYWARGASDGDIRDDGTLAPTAAGGSVPFAPEIAVPALEAMHDRYGDLLYNEYGFRDAFNPSFEFKDVRPAKGSVVSGRGWFDSDQLGIDQGPILLMIENYRTGLIWQVMKKNPYLVRGLRKAGFSGGWLAQPVTSATGE
jgi:hypothetical protein